MKKSAIILLIFSVLTIAISWVNSTNVFTKTHPIHFIVPKGWPQPLYDFKQNPLTEEGFTLGRKLFYDGMLSKDGNFSCASCHQQFAAFATYDHALSHGFGNSFSFRNAPGLFNLAWQKDFMWDGGINHLDLQPLAPMTDPHEMAENLDSVLLKIKTDTSYKRMFSAAFGKKEINTQLVTKAISQFVLMLVSADSKYDRVMQGKDSFNLPQKLGYEIFQEKCISCHTPPFFTDFSFRNTGLALDDYLKDYGRMRITGNPADSLKFRVPSLRNVQQTFPYSHDGRFGYLDAVFEHYRGGVIQSNTTDSLLKNGIPLSNFEFGQLKAFLYTLTDSSFLSNPLFALPGEKRNEPLPDAEQHSVK